MRPSGEAASTTAGQTVRNTKTVCLKRPQVLATALAADPLVDGEPAAERLRKLWGAVAAKRRWGYHYRGLTFAAGTHYVFLDSPKVSPSPRLLPFIFMWSDHIESELERCVWAFAV